MGITGAAVATTIGRGIAVLYQLKLLFFNNKRFETVISDFIPNFKLLLQLLKISAGGVFQYIISTFSWIILVRIISKFGSVAVAGYTIGIRVVLFLMLPAWGLSNAAGTLTGQNLGAGKPERAERTIFIISGLTAIYMFICASVLFFGSEHIMQLFVNETDVIAHGSNALEIISVGLVFFGLGGVSMQALNGAGDTFTPTLINFIVFWIIEIPLAYFLAIELDMRDKGVYWTIVMMDVLIAVLAFILFRRGKWKLRKV
jgi:putative MATE family efflux protein